jgi:hypothetical protein
VYKLIDITIKYSNLVVVKLTLKGNIIYLSIITLIANYIQQFASRIVIVIYLSSKAPSLLYLYAYALRKEVILSIILVIIYFFLY